MPKLKQPTRPNRDKPKLPCPEIAVLSTCETFVSMKPNPFYKEEMERYEAEMKQYRKKQS